jgi:penicillin amidase
MIFGVRRAVWLILSGAVLAFVLIAAAAYFYLRASLPTTSGEIEVHGLSAPVDIVRDRDAIPHIYAANKLDSLFGLGYVHAQDRLWQMEFQRRIGFGRLSEILGPAALPQDKFLRTVGFGRAARSAWSRLPAQTKREIDAYVAGINAFLTEHHGRALPPEFTLLRFEPEPWTGADVIVWQKMMAWDLSANYSFELLRSDIVQRVGDAALADLMPPYSRNGLSITEMGDDGATGRTAETDGSSKKGGTGRTSRTNEVNPAGEAGGVATHRRSAANQPEPPDLPLFSAFASALSTGDPMVRDVLLGGSRAESIGSNNWVVDGTLTASGKPLLANDPHLSARVPSIWYLAHISGGDYDAIGATIPGTPAVVLGRNRFIAWGATNVAADVQDLYREKLDPTGRFAEFLGQQEPLQIIPETIAVKGQDAIRLLVRVSRHGPLISDAIDAMNQASPERRGLPPLEPLAFRWTALDPDDTTVVAMMRMSESHDWHDFTSALREFVVPSQNFVYADVDGHIGYYAPGRIPIRAAGDGTLPVDGWTGTAEWTGWVPFEKLPHAYDPPEHLIITANNRPASPDYPYLLGVEWTEPYRAQRILDRLRSKTRLNPDDFASIQADTLSLSAQILLPVLLTHAVPHNPRDTEAIRILRRWNDDARRDSAAAAIFQAWFLRLVPTLVEDDLGPLTMQNYAGRFSYVTRFILRVLDSPATSASADGGRQSDRGDSPGASSAGSSATVPGAGQTLNRSWCDDQRTPATETCDDAVSTALDEAVTDLTRRLKGEMERWRWDGVHRAIFPHQGLDSVALLRPLLSRSVPSGGDWSTIDVGAVAVDAPYEQHSVAGYRQIVDLSQGNDSRFADAVGESGHPLSPRYDDSLPDWTAVRHHPMRMNRSDVERDAAGRLRLRPR